MSRETKFGQKLRELRKAKGFSQRDLADKVAVLLRAGEGRGFDFTYLSKIETGYAHPPSIAAIIHLARVLEADENELIALAGKLPPDLGETLKESQAARTFYRSVLDANLSEDDWTKLLQELKRR